MKKSILYLLVFILLQLCVGTIVTGVWKIVTGSDDTTTAMLITTAALSSLLTIIVFLAAQWAEVSPTWLRTRPWAVLAWSVVAALGAIIPSTWLQELMPELPNVVENEFEMILGNRWGYLAVSLLAPLAEELVFRGAILRGLLTLTAERRHGVALSIALSALLFAISHFNPAQMPHAFLIGLLLGWMYWRTGSILPGMAYHWANNSAAFVIFNMYPDPDIHLVDIFQGSQTHVLLAVGFSLLILLPALYQLHVWMRRA